MNWPTFGWSNKRGTRSRHCPCESWQTHWMNISKQPWPTTCSVAHCALRASVGGHLVYAADNTEFIVPLCDVCHQLERPFSLKEEITLVPATPSAACRGL